MTRSLASKAKLDEEGAARERLQRLPTDLIMEDKEKLNCLCEAILNTDRATSVHSTLSLTLRYENQLFQNLHNSVRIMWKNVLHYLNPNININLSIIFIFCLSYFLEHTFHGSNQSENVGISEDGDVHQVSIVNTLNTQNSIFNKNSSILFIGGVPKSGTTLMRILLDIHSMIR